MTEKVLIGVCTHKRPQMLKRCLSSLLTQNTSPDINFSIVVVDNEAWPNRRGAVRHLATSSPVTVEYVHEPRRGISFARNAVLDRASAIEADWIAFIDDDEIADPNWVSGLMTKEYRHVPVLMGRHEFIYPDPLPFWCIPKEPPAQEGKLCRAATTGNVRFSAALIHAGLRFNEALALSGGEDNEFFARARALGFEIRRTDRAVTRETAHPERLTFAGQAYRAYWCAASDMVALRARRGRWRPWAKAPSIVWSAGAALVLSLAAALVAPVGRDRFKRLSLHAARRAAKAAGRTAGLIGVLPQPYRETVGA